MAGRLVSCQTLQVNLCYGLPVGGDLETCTAGAGTLTLEFTLLSRLLGDPVYESLARRAVRAIWERRHKFTGLVGEENMTNTHPFFLFFLIRHVVSFFIHLFTLSFHPVSIFLSPFSLSAGYLVTEILDMYAKAKVY